MKKLLVLILFAVIFLSACHEQNSSEDAKKKGALAAGYETARECNMYSNLCMNGMLFSESFDGSDFVLPRTYFFDFDSMKSAMLCSKPNCKHDNYETCTAFGLSTFAAPVIIGKNLYFFSGETRWGGKGELLSQMDIVKADVDGSSRREIATIEDTAYVRTVFVKGDVIYFITQDQGYDPETKTYIDKRANSLYSFDVSTEECTNHGLVLDGYSSHVDIVGEFNGKLYLQGAYLDEPAVFGENKKFNDYYGSFDMETGEIGEWDMPISSFNEYEKPKGMFISGGYYGYTDGENAHIIDSEGNEMVLEGYELSGSSTTVILNGYLFDVDGIDHYSAINLSTGEIRKVSKKAVPKWNFVLTYHNGNYIVYSLTGGDGFKKVLPEEIFEVVE